MNTSILHTEPKGIVTPSGDSSSGKATLSTFRNLGGTFVWVALLAGALLFLFSAPVARAHQEPPGCAGSGLGILLFTDKADAHIGDTVSYSVTVFNGTPGNPLIACDAEGIQAFVVTPDGVSHTVPLVRTALHNGQSDFYLNVASYVIRCQDVRRDGTVRATANDVGTSHQNDTDSQGGGFQGVNTEVIRPCIQITAQCVPGVGENGVISFTGTVTNCGNVVLHNVTVTNFVNGQATLVFGPTSLATNQAASFSGSYVPANPCIPSTATLTAQGTDDLTATTVTVTSSANTTCQNTLTPGIRVTKVCPAQPVSPGQLLTFSGSVRTPAM